MISINAATDTRLGVARGRAPLEEARRTIRAAAAWAWITRGGPVRGRTTVVGHPEHAAPAPHRGIEADRVDRFAGQAPMRWNRLA